MTRKQVKKAGRETLKGHYVLFAALCLLGALLGRGFAFSTTLTQTVTTGRIPTLQTAALPAGADVGRTLLSLARDGEGVSQTLWERERALSEQGGEVLGRSRGVLARVLNKVQSGAWLADGLAALTRLTGSERAGLVLLALACAAFVFLMWFLVQNVYAAAVRRVFLEGRVYPGTAFGRLYSFLPLRRWGRAAATLFMKTLFQLLWSLTVVGGVVKYCAYFPVPYLVAENPELDFRRALELSERMMEGHKGELLRLELSFLGWRALSVFTLGLSGALFSRPYRLAVLSEYYCGVRAQWLARHPQDASALNDPWLFRRPDEGELDRAYADLPARRAAADAVPEPTGPGGFIARNFGILLTLGAEERAYAQAVEERARLDVLEREAAGESYPLRLAPGGPRRVPARVRGVRCYWIWSFVAIFFVFCVGGWLWEVAYAFGSTEALVNRGMLHGPWLPIYGTGACLILALLYRFRARPGVQFLLAAALCGVLEYYTGLWMELVNGGQRWWSYDGHFLNLNGRICAEGLLLFALGGCVAVYLVAPRLDALLRKAPKGLLIGVCAAALVLFAADELWSAVEPNTGPGITERAPAEFYTDQTGPQ